MHREALDNSHILKVESKPPVQRIFMVSIKICNKLEILNDSKAKTMDAVQFI